MAKSNGFGEKHILGAAYAVALPAFEGPLDLLLQLIEKEELDITEVSLVAVTDPYLQALSHLDVIEPGALADFLVIASRLLFIKSRSLLPKPVPVDDDGEEDVGDALIRQLIEYRQFKEIASQLKDREEAGLRVYLRLAPLPDFERRLDLSDVDGDKLQQALRRALERIPVDPPIPQMRPYTITVADQIENVRDLLREKRGEGRVQSAPGAVVAFTDLLSSTPTRMEVIVTFLAVLELIKQLEIEAIQLNTFGDIDLLPSPLDLGDTHVNAPDAEAAAADGRDLR